MKVPGSDQIHRESGTSTVGGGRSIIRSTTGNRTPSSSALEELTHLPRTESPRKGDRNKSDQGKRRRHDGSRERRGGEGKSHFLNSSSYTQHIELSFRSGIMKPVLVRPSMVQGIQLAVGPQQLRLRNHNFAPTNRIMVKHLATSPHDPLGITDSACKNQLVVVSVQYGPFNTYIPIRSTTIGTSRVARDPIIMHNLGDQIVTSRVLLDSIGYPRMNASGESSTTKHRLLHASGPHPIPPPNDPS
ncbi:hypothetical protein F511_35425 [Dorcoceras hygrometricum]|uniref:Uncharacterized protein n=1 Tax=Dorcoceras hygrometricum TaxID=472368 RepID=A0A2Z7BQ82_9LAMI|nr:hypothetical protein F511_35425 [Dorcoceras hygrometricum]